MGAAVNVKISSDDPARGLRKPNPISDIPGLHIVQRHIHVRLEARPPIWIGEGAYCAPTGDNHSLGGIAVRYGVENNGGHHAPEGHLDPNLEGRAEEASQSRRGVPGICGPSINLNLEHAGDLPTGRRESPRHHIDLSGCAMSGGG